MPPDNHLPDIHIPLPLALYVIPLAFMVEYIAQQLWAFIHQSFRNVEDLFPPSSSPLPPPSSSSEEGNSVSAYATPSSSPSPVLLVKMMKGKQQEGSSWPLCKPVKPLPCLICQSVEHALGDCPEFHRLPILREGRPQCILCQEEGHGISGCPKYQCPICLYPTPGHGNNSCPNSPIDPDSSDGE